MDFKKLEKISIELTGTEFKKVTVGGWVLMILEVYKDIYTIQEAKEIIAYTKR